MADVIATVVDVITTILQLETMTIVADVNISHIGNNISQSFSNM